MLQLVGNMHTRDQSLCLERQTAKIEAPIFDVTFAGPFSDKGWEAHQGRRAEATCAHDLCTWPAFFATCKSQLVTQTAKAAYSAKARGKWNHSWLYVLALPSGSGKGYVQKPLLHFSGQLVGLIDLLGVVLADGVLRCGRFCCDVRKVVPPPCCPRPWGLLLPLLGRAVGRDPTKLHQLSWPLRDLCPKLVPQRWHRCVVYVSVVAAPPFEDALVVQIYNHLVLKVARQLRQNEQDGFQLCSADCLLSWQRAPGHGCKHWRCPRRQTNCSPTTSSTPRV